MPQHVPLFLSNSLIISFYKKVKLKTKTFSGMISELHDTHISGLLNMANIEAASGQCFIFAWIVHNIDVDLYGLA